MLSLSASRLSVVEEEVAAEPAGELYAAVKAHARAGAGGLVVLGTFGSGKTQLCTQLGVDGDLCATVVPLRDVARFASIEDGLQKIVGAGRLEEAREGVRTLLLDGFDEVPPPAIGHTAWFEELVARAGPRWVLTSRPGHFRTEKAEPVPDQVDVLDRPDTAILQIDPLPRQLVRDAIGALPSGATLLQSVEGLIELATSPLLFHVVHAALPFIEPGRPIRPWGVFDAWIRFALSSGPGHDVAVLALEELAWSSFRDHGFSHEVPTWSGECVAEANLPPSLRRALLVTDLDGRLRFGHRSVYEFLLASRIAPQLVANQGQGPDELSGLRLTDAVRVFIVGRAPMPVVYDGETVRIPAGNFVAGGETSADERPLRIEHLGRPFVVSRAPVTNADWARFLAAHPDHRVDAHYLRHWGIERRVPAGQADLPVYHVWPEDADRYAAWAGGRLPTASEWEKAVRGLDGRRWPWGDFFEQDAAVTAELGLQRPLPVRAFGARGEAGLFSAVGGVFEYTSSDYRDRPDRGRIVMGGCYTHPAATSRASLRLSHKLSGNLKAGLRLAWNARD